MELTYNVLCSFLEQREVTSSRLKDNIAWFSELRQSIIDALSEDQVKSLTSKIKSRLQWEANLAHKEAGRWGLICKATGTGKSKTAIDAIKALVNHKADATILLVVPTTKLRDKTWRNEFTQWGIESVFHTNVIKVCYASLAKMKGSHYDLVVLDEVHNITEANSQFFKFNTTSACMALTATKPDDIVKRNILRNLNLKLVYEITLDEAVNLGVVAPYEITVVEVELDKIRRNVKAGSKAKPFFSTEASNYAYFTKVEMSDDPEVKKRVNKFFYINRMKFIYNLNSKTEAAQLLLRDKIPNSKRTLIFCGSIDQANKLCLNTYHSESGDASYDKFINMEVNRLACVEALNEGDNLPEVDIAFIVQLNSNSLDIVQRIGRIIRFRFGHVGKIVILVAKGTVDAKWAKAALKELNSSKITWVDYSDITSGSYILNL